MTPVRPLHFLLLLACWLVMPARADILLVVNPDSPLLAMTASEASNLYLGRTHAMANGQPVMLIDHPRDSDVRARFFKSLSGMDLRRVNAYWARLQFSGGTQPPIQLDTEREIIEIVRHNRLAVGYVDQRAATAGLRVVLVLGEQ